MSQYLAASGIQMHFYVSVIAWRENGQGNKSGDNSNMARIFRSTSQLAEAAIFRGQIRATWHQACRSMSLSEECGRSP